MWVAKRALARVQEFWRREQGARIAASPAEVFGPYRPFCEYRPQGMLPRPDFRYTDILELIAPPTQMSSERPA